MSNIGIKPNNEIFEFGKLIIDVEYRDFVDLGYRKQLIKAEQLRDMAFHEIRRKVLHSKEFNMEWNNENIRNVKKALLTYAKSKIQ